MSSYSEEVGIQTEDFSIQTEYERLKRKTANQTGAICTFTGLVREFGDKPDIQGLFLEHYPGMTERSLEHIIQQAKQRWQVLQVKVIHRVGSLQLNDQIVFVGVASAHRADAFSACEFIMDYLKTDAPFWKKELSSSGSEWVEAKQSDATRKQNWHKHETR